MSDAVNSTLLNNNKTWTSIGVFNKTLDVLVGKVSKANDIYHRCQVAYITPFGHIFETEKYVDLASGKFRNIKALERDEMGVEIRKTGIEAETRFDYQDVVKNSPMEMVVTFLRNNEIS